ncbi:CubicO group peptidase, beta-lactamase class C family [Bradyrhizobium sp. OK095]|nr:CubicO group peptidase, beta-lactamase class C family [Bradyrhizobium sp. OK095]
MRAWGSVVAALCAFTLSPVGVQIASGAEAASSCGIPADIHDGWTMTAPEKQGLNATLLCAMDDGISGGKLANVDDIVIVRHGVLVYERYYSRFDATTRHNGYSMTKSVVSLLVGIAMDRGLIKDLDTPVVSYFPDNADLRMPDKDPITLRHLLTMSAGLGSSKAPGISFAYSDGETELIGAILKKVTGKTVDVLAQENLFAPLGIKDVNWRQDPFSGLPASANGLSLRPRDWAKIGQLVLNRGVWEGQQIVPASWVDHRRLSRSRRMSRSLVAMDISGGLVDHRTRTATFNGLLRRASIPRRSSSSARSTWLSSSTRPGNPNTWSLPSWTSWTDTFCPRLQRMHHGQSLSCAETESRKFAMSRSRLRRTTGTSGPYCTRSASMTGARATS